MIDERLGGGDPADARALLGADALDRARVVDAGQSGHIRQIGCFAIKIAHDSPAQRIRLAEECATLRRLQSPRIGIAVPRLYVAQPAQGVLVRDFVPWPRLLDLMRALGGKPDAELLAQLRELRQQVLAFERSTGIELDLSPANIFVDETRGSLVLADAGARLDPNPLLRCTEDELPAALERYLAWREQFEQRATLRPLVWPPSRRFTVEVPVGRPARGHLLWVNRKLVHDLGLAPGDRAVEEFANLSTRAPRPTGVRLASRYQDTPEVTSDSAKGDGRSVYLGALPGGPYGRREVQLKGAGPTPLAWIGHQYHEDGRVSFQRTLWETAIADELARLGFETPQMLAILDTGATTVDNTDQRWPAASAVRVASTHFRVGHLALWSHRPRDRAALRSLLLHVGRLILGPDFDVQRAGHLERLALGFHRNLGHDLGRSAALNIRCFHPTLGNMRVDGHFIDFSTVRIFRHDLPDFVFLNNRWKVAKDLPLWLRHAQAFVQIYREAGLLDAERCARLQRRGRRLLLQRYDDGYLVGLFSFVGHVGQRAVAGSATQRRALVGAAIALRRLRGPGVVRFDFFKQRCAAPLFDLEDRCPDFVRAWNGRAREPWRALLIDPDCQVSARQRQVAERFVRALGAALTTRQRRALAPRRWFEVIRPCIEAETLSQICYQRSTPRDFALWRQRLATSLHLPAGTYDYFAARAAARALGHLAFSGLRPFRYEFLVGMRPELYQAVGAVFDRVLGDALIGSVAHGSRVMTRQRLFQVDPSAFAHGTLRRSDAGLREYGPHPRKSSDLDLKVFVRAGPRPTELRRLGFELGRALRELCALFPLCGHEPPFVRLFPTAATELLRAFASYNRGTRQRLQGKSPISEEQAVLFYRPSHEHSDPIESVVDELRRAEPAPDCAEIPLHCIRAPKGSSLATGCGLSWHQLELCLRDDDAIEPPAIEVKAIGAGRFELVGNAGAFEAARRAGRHTIRARR